MCKLIALLTEFARVGCTACGGSKNQDDTVSGPGDAEGMGLSGGEPGMTAREFGQRRRAAGVTMEEAARMLRCSSKSIWRWENGQNPIDRYKADVIRRTLLPGIGPGIGRAKGRRIVTVSSQGVED
jgi:DNA-binding XRE family transcriptional regulator